MQHETHVKCTPKPAVYKLGSSWTYLTSRLHSTTSYMLCVSKQNTGYVLLTSSPSSYQLVTKMAIVCRGCAEVMQTDVISATHENVLIHCTTIQHVQLLCLTANLHHVMLVGTFRYLLQMLHGLARPIRSGGGRT